MLRLTRGLTCFAASILTLVLVLLTTQAAQAQLDFSETVVDLAFDPNDGAGGLLNTGLAVNPTFWPGLDPNTPNTSFIDPNGGIDGGGLRIDPGTTDAAGYTGLNLTVDLPGDPGFGDLARAGTFSGKRNFSVSFEFQVPSGIDPGDEGIHLFSAEGASSDPNLPVEDPGGQTHSLSMGITAGGDIATDFWFIGAFDSLDTGINVLDGEIHSVTLQYSALTGGVELTLDDADPVEFAFEEPGPFERDTVSDRTSAGNNTWGLAGAEWIAGEAEFLFPTVCSDCVFDNLLIERSDIIVPVLDVQVNRDTGDITIAPIDPNSALNTISQIDLSSAVGALDPSFYGGIAGSSVDPNSTWAVTTLDNSLIIDAQDPNLGGTDFSLAGTISLKSGAGLLWRTSPFEDLEVVSTDPNGKVLPAVVTFTGTDPNNTAAPLLGDISDNGINSTQDGVVDVNDWNKFILGFSDPNSLNGLIGFDAYFLGDLNVDGIHSVDDYVEFANAFDAANGAGAFQAMISGVPEPSTVVLSLLGGTWLLGRRKRVAGVAVSQVSRQRLSFKPWIVLCAALLLTIGSVTQAAELAKYEFTSTSCTDPNSDYCDTSGNSRDGIGVPGDAIGFTPTVSSGVVTFSGDIREAIEVPLGSAYPFDGTQDWTFEVTFSTTGNDLAATGEQDPNTTEQIILGAFATGSPANPVYSPLSVRIGPTDAFLFWRTSEETGEFGEMEIPAVPGVNLYDGAPHTLLVTHVAPEDPNDEESLGQAWIQLDGNWAGPNEEFGETFVRQFTGSSEDPNNISPDLGPTSFTTLLGDSLDSDFVEGESRLGFKGTMDNVVIRDNNVAPTSGISAEVDLTTGEVTILGGEFNRNLKYVELASETGLLDPNGWSSFDDQNLDPDPNANPLGNWTELRATETSLVEAKVISTTEFSDSVNSSVSLGAAFDPNSLVGDLTISAVDIFNAVIDIPVEFVNLTGDFNGDLRVDAQDFLEWQRDPNIGDLADWNANYGNSLTFLGGGEEEELVSAVATVPEPATLLFITSGVVCAISSRRRSACI